MAKGQGMGLEIGKVGAGPGDCEGTPSCPEEETGLRPGQIVS